MNDIQTSDNGAQGPSADTLTSALFYLMSRFAFSQDTALVHAITTHFAMLQEHADSSPQLQRTCRRLRAQWLAQLDAVNLQRARMQRKPGTEVGLRDLH